jgi:peptide/nickel transport system substrate-binding protein
MFFTNWVADVATLCQRLDRRPRHKGGWFGWAEDARSSSCAMPARAGSLEEQKKIAADLQKHAYEQAIYIPLRQYFAASA